MRKILLLLLVLSILFCFTDLKSYQEQPKNDADYYNWLGKYESAKSSLRTGELLSVLGGFTGTLGMVLYITRKTEEVEYGFLGLAHYKEKQDPTFLALGICGIAISVAGFIIDSQARTNVRSLELEGARKGYITARLIPIRKGLAINLMARF